MAVPQKKTSTLASDQQNWRNYWSNSVKHYYIAFINIVMNFEIHDE